MWLTVVPCYVGAWWRHPLYLAHPGPFRVVELAAQLSRSVLILTPDVSRAHPRRHLPVVPHR